MRRFLPPALVATWSVAGCGLNLGLGPSSRFSAGDHQYSGSGSGTGIRPDGSFTNLCVWSAGQAIEFFE